MERSAGLIAAERSFAGWPRLCSRHLVVKQVTGKQLCSQVDCVGLEVLQVAEG